MADMNDPKTRTMMRGLVTGIDDELTGMLAGGAEQNARAVRLQDSWKKVVATLDLGPEPDVYPCPSCGKPSRRDARRCGYCWKALVT
jgi:hypothetical protein